MQRYDDPALYADYDPESVWKRVKVGRVRLDRRGFAVLRAVAAARERFGGPLGIVFQPHGYGPLGFMREALAEHLGNCLKPGDRFVFLPVYYAGGTSSFKPTSAELAAEFAAGRARLAEAIAAVEAHHDDSR